MSEPRPTSAARPPSPRRPSAVTPGSLEPLLPLAEAQRRLEHAAASSGSSPNMPPMARPPSASAHRMPVSPRAPSPLRVPGSPNNGGAAVGDHNLLSPPGASNFNQSAEAAMQSYLAQHMPSAVQTNLQAWCGANVEPMLQGALQGWCAANVEPMLQGALNQWCTQNAQPLLASFLEGWMNMNAATLLQNQLHGALQPLRDQIDSQASKIRDLESALARAQSSRPSSAEHTPNGEPAPFTPTLPFTPSLPFSVSNPSGVPQTLPGGSGSGLGFGAGRKSTTGLGKSVGMGGGSGLNEDGVVAPVDVKAIIRSRMSSGPGGLGLGRGAAQDLRGPVGTAIASNTSMPGPGEEVSAERDAVTRRMDAAAAGAPTPGGVVGGAMGGSPVLSSGSKRTTGLGLGGGSGSLAANNPGRASGSAASGGRGKPAGPVDIIVVEDLGVAQKIAHAALTRGHYKVEVAGDGLAAIELFKKCSGSLKAVLMDIHLPGISGIETTERIRKLEQEAGTQPVWIYGLTGDVAEDDLRSYKACGMNGCILKGKLLADAVKQAMEESQNGVEFVNLCDKQGGGGSASSSGSASATAHAFVPQAAAAAATGDKPHASAAEKLRQENASGTASALHGTPRAPLPRQLVMDKYTNGKAQVKPGIGLPSAGGGGNSPIAQSGNMQMPERSSAVGPNLLLVEDVRVSLKIASQALQRAGFKVIAAENGESAVEKYKQHSSSLTYIIMDINLPGISGIEAAEQIRVLEKRIGAEEPLYIFGLTGNVDAESMRNYESAGMNGCILKGKVLSEAVKQAIEEAQQGKFVNIS